MARNNSNGHRVLSSPHDLDQVFIECRGPLRHAWYEIEPEEPRSGTIAKGHILFSARCERCGTERHEAWHRNSGQLLFRRYRRPDGYAPISRDYHAEDLRLELLNRWDAAGFI